MLPVQIDLPKMPTVGPVRSQITPNAPRAENFQSFITNSNTCTLSGDRRICRARLAAQKVRWPKLHFRGTNNDSSMPQVQLGMGSQTSDGEKYRRSIGVIGGALQGVKGFVAATELGLAVASSVAPIAALAGSGAKALLGGLAGAAVGCITGATLGEAVDELIFDGRRCLDCGLSFSQHSRV